eukprot:Sspe_Gene.35774::Locus_17317_Transcript_1_1_Confidence_1.000_Length_909::g.35774::m.35774
MMSGGKLVMLCSSASTGPQARLLERGEVQHARQLLYDVYVEEQGWDVNANPANPSQLRACHTSRELFDVYDTPDMQGYCHWIGCFDQGKMVGVLRILQHHPKHGYEVSRYGIPLPPSLASKRCMEMNRLAFAKCLRKQKLWRALVSYARMTAAMLGAELLFSTSQEHLIPMYLVDPQLRPVPDAPRFKYNPDEPHHVTFVQCPVVSQHKL